jgi:hypothetical protein
MTARLTKGTHWSLKGDAPANPHVTANREKIRRETVRSNVIQSKCSPRNFVELLDLINRTEYFGVAHCFDVINDAL